MTEVWIVVLVAVGVFGVFGGLIAAIELSARDCKCEACGQRGVVSYTDHFSAKYSIVRSRCRFCDWTGTEVG